MMKICWVLIIQIFTRRQNQSSITLGAVRVARSYTMTVIATSSHVLAIQVIQMMLWPRRQLVMPCLAPADIHHKQSEVVFWLGVPGHEREAPVQEGVARGEWAVPRFSFRVGVFTTFWHQHGSDITLFFCIILCFHGPPMSIFFRSELSILVFFWQTFISHSKNRNIISTLCHVKAMGMKKKTCQISKGCVNK